MAPSPKPRPIYCPQEGDAPLKVSVEVWPDEMRARATLVEKGKAKDIEISSFALAMILSAIRKAR